VERTHKVWVEMVEGGEGWALEGIKTISGSKNAGKGMKVVGGKWAFDI